MAVVQCCTKTLLCNCKRNAPVVDGNVGNKSVFIANLQHVANIGDVRVIDGKIGNI